MFYDSWLGQARFYGGRRRWMRLLILLVIPYFLTVLSPINCFFSICVFLCISALRNGALSSTLGPRQSLLICNTSSAVTEALYCISQICFRLSMQQFDSMLGWVAENHVDMNGFGDGDQTIGFNLKCNCMTTNLHRLETHNVIWCDLQCFNANFPQLFSLLCYFTHEQLLVNSNRIPAALRRCQFFFNLIKYKDKQHLPISYNSMATAWLKKHSYTRSALKRGKNWYISRLSEQQQLVHISMMQPMCALHMPVLSCEWSHSSGWEPKHTRTRLNILNDKILSQLTFWGRCCSTHLADILSDFES